MYYDHRNRAKPDGFTFGLRLIGEALIGSVRGLGAQSVDTHWSKIRAAQCGC